MSAIGKATLAKFYCSIPRSGALWGTAVLAGGAAPALGPTTLTIGDLSLACSVVRSGEEAPGSALAVLRGGPGWWLPLVRGESWQSDAGVRLKTALAALQKATGETLALPPDVSLGSSFGWPKAGATAPSTGAMVLDALVRRGAVPTWRVDTDGTTRFDVWPTIGAADSKGRLLRRKLTVGCRVVGLDISAKPFLPGATLEGLPVARVVYCEDAGELRAEAWER